MSLTNICGCLAYSLAGHDKGQVYVIVSFENGYVYLADGRIKTTEMPKKKKLKHIQLIKKNIRDIKKSDSDETDGFSNEEIKRAIKLFLREGKEEN